MNIKKITNCIGLGLLVATSAQGSCDLNNLRAWAGEGLINFFHRYGICEQDGTARRASQRDYDRAFIGYFKSVSEEGGVSCHAEEVLVDVHPNSHARDDDGHTADDYVARIKNPGMKELCQRDLQVYREGEKRLKSATNAGGAPDLFNRKGSA
jgi:hypothetical protein